MVARYGYGFIVLRHNDARGSGLHVHVANRATVPAPLGGAAAGADARVGGHLNVVARHHGRTIGTGFGDGQCRLVSIGVLLSSLAASSTARRSHDSAQDSDGHLRWGTSRADENHSDMNR